MSGLSRASCPPSPRPCGELDGPNPFRSALTSRRPDQTFMDQRAFTEQVCECRDNGYLPSSKKIGSGAFSKVYLAYATQERIQHNSKLASDLRGKRHTTCLGQEWAGRPELPPEDAAHRALPRPSSATCTKATGPVLPHPAPEGLWASHGGHPPSPQVAIKMVSTAEASVEFSCKFLPREISSLNATYKHLNVVQLYETYQNSWRAYLVLELAARGDLLEHINAVSDHCRCPGLEQEEARRLFWQLNSLLSTFCGSVAYTALEVLTSKKYSGGQAAPWSLGVILYATVTRKLPFKEHQPHRMLHLMRRGPTLRPGLSPEWDDPSELPALLAVMAAGWGARGAGGAVASVGRILEPSPAECQDLIRGLLQLRPRARLRLQQCSAASLQVLHAHQCGQVGGSSAPHVTLPLQSVAEKPEESQLPTSPDNVQPSADSDPPRPHLHLRRPQQQGTPPPLESACGPAPEPRESPPRRGAILPRWDSGARRRPVARWAPPGVRCRYAPCLPSGACLGTTWLTEGGREGGGKVK
ncbi:hypothetical protein J1605_013963 [Eschrichtius robustus]|uniref:non-specific serine/threonine protein kinase n=1 Tax=Eschrichtius robustus TaxID=9764 RepID=A0AB34GG74_ESCRO|nr:hypothetical protein J1605_013963 [Eschrichtius robustus]